jgi:hypothetical protein
LDDVPNRDLPNTTSISGKLTKLERSSNMRRIAIVLVMVTVGVTPLLAQESDQKAENASEEPKVANAAVTLDVGELAFTAIFAGALAFDLEYHQRLPLAGFGVSVAPQLGFADGPFFGAYAGPAYYFGDGVSLLHVKARAGVIYSTAGEMFIPGYDVLIGSIFFGGDGTSGFLFGAELGVADYGFGPSLNWGIELGYGFPRRNGSEA